MKRSKPIRDFLVRVRGGGPQIIQGESFFLARQESAVALGVEPDDIRPVQPAGAR